MTTTFSPPPVAKKASEEVCVTCLHDIYQYNSDYIVIVSRTSLCRTFGFNLVVVRVPILIPNLLANFIFSNILYKDPITMYNPVPLMNLAGTIPWVRLPAYFSDPITTYNPVPLTNLAGTIPWVCLPAYFSAFAPCAVMYPPSFNPPFKKVRYFFNLTTIDAVFTCSFFSSFLPLLVSCHHRSLLVNGKLFIYLSN